jgi:hypothetical protein
MFAWLDRLGALFVMLPLVFLGLIGVVQVVGAITLTSLLLFDPNAVPHLRTGVFTWLALLLLAGSGTSLITIAGWTAKRDLRALGFKL